MTRLDAAQLRENDAKCALDRQLRLLGSLVERSKRAVLLGEQPPVGSLHVRAQAVQEAAEIWDATRQGVRVAGRADQAKRGVIHSDQTCLDHGVSLSVCADVHRQRSPYVQVIPPVYTPGPDPRPHRYLQRNQSAR